MTQYEDEYLDEIESRIQSDISRQTGYKFRKETPETAEDWKFYMDCGAVQDPEAFGEFAESIEKRRCLYEGDGFLDVRWRG